MDYIIIIVSIAVVVLLFLMYVVSKFLMRERSYDKHKIQVKQDLEDAAVEQKPGKKRRQVHSKSQDKQKSSDEKVINSNAASKVLITDSALSSSPSKKHVEIEPRVETIDPELESLIERPILPENTNQPNRSILLNKDEKSPVINSGDVPETFHPRPAPVGELDRKRQQDARRLSDTVSQDDLERLKNTPESQKTSSPGGKSNSKKKKKGKVCETGDDLEGKAAARKTETSKKDATDAVGAVLKMLENGEVEKEDAVALMKLLDFQGFGIKPDETAVHMLQKQFVDLEASLLQEKSTVASSNAQVQRLQSELSAEHMKFDELKKHQQSQIDKQLEEITYLKDQLQQTSKLLDQERNHFQAKVELLRAEIADETHTVQVLKQESGRLNNCADFTQNEPVRKDFKPNSGVAGVSASESTDASQQYLEENVKQFEDMITKQDVDKIKEDSDILVLSLRNHIAKLESKIVEKDTEMDLLQSHAKEPISVEKPVAPEPSCVIEYEVKVTSIPPVCAATLVENCDEQVGRAVNEMNIGLYSNGEITFQDERVRDLELQLQEQKQKNDSLRRKNWKAMEALSELESQLHQTVHEKTDHKGKSGSVAHVKDELKAAVKEKQDLERQVEDQKKRIAILQQQIAYLQKEVENNSLKRIKEHSLNVERRAVDHEADILNIEESLNRQIQKNDDLRRRNWKTMEALSQMEKQMENQISDRLQLKSELDLKTEEINELKNRLLNEEKKDHSTENVSQTMAFNLNDSQLKRIAQLEAFLVEKDNHIKQVEEELYAVQNTLSHVSLPTSTDMITLPTVEIQSSSALSPSTSGTEVNRKEVMFVTRIQESTKWDMSQLVLELDTKTAEVEILQSLLERNENALHVLQEEKSKNLETIVHMRQALKEKDASIELQAQLWNSSVSSEDTKSAAEGEMNSVAKILLQKDDDINQLKAELLCFQSQVKDFETRERLSVSLPSNSMEETIDEDESTAQDSVTDDNVPGNIDIIKAEHRSLQDQVKHYQAVLAETASMLNKLQSSVEQEEHKWHQKVAEAEQRAAQANQEMKVLRDELESLQRSS